MKIAIPLARGKLSLHFGHCEAFALIEVDENKKQITKTDILDAPPHQPGFLPRWLAEKGAQVIITGGMGQRAQAIFAEHNIEVIVGAKSETPEEIVTAYLNGTLETSDNICDH